LEGIKRWVEESGLKEGVIEHTPWPPLERGNNEEALNRGNERKLNEEKFTQQHGK
jgi:hypothetical protein